MVMEIAEAYQKSLMLFLMSVKIPKDVQILMHVITMNMPILMMDHAGMLSLDMIVMGSCVISHLQ